MFKVAAFRGEGSNQRSVCDRVGVYKVQAWRIAAKRQRKLFVEILKDGYFSGVAW